MKLLVVKSEEGTFFHSGWGIHHAHNKRGAYCGWLLHSTAKKIRTSELNYHTGTCLCGSNEEEAIGNNDIRGLFGSINNTKPYLLSPADKKKLNNAISHLILSTLRPYEIANEPFCTISYSHLWKLEHGMGPSPTAHFTLIYLAAIS